MQKDLRERPLVNIPRFIAAMKPKMVPKMPDDRFQMAVGTQAERMRVSHGGSPQHAVDEF